MNPDPRAYYLSDRAYNNLVGMAQRTRFVQWGTNRAKGLSEFLNELSIYPLEDTRPPLVKRRHMEEIKHNRAPTWLNVRLRRSRLLKLNDDAIQSYFEAAYNFGIIRKEPFAVGGPSRKTPYAAVSFVLEAIGLGWITPAETPIGTKVN